MTAPRLEKLRHFIQEVDALHRQFTDESPLLEAVAQRLARLVRQDDWLPDEYALPHPHHYQQYLLHADSGQRFSIVSFVWGPGQATPIHDHRVWGVIGMLRGAEENQRYRLDTTGLPVADGIAGRLSPGEVEKVSSRDGDIHRVSNALAESVSISIHVYGGNIGAVKRAVYTPEGLIKPFISGYSNRHLPNIWDFPKDN
ncbi:cysteine dioxygenase [Raoultella ornithinolytica]|uniref:cysteine dioxygenase family protein n=1 Tax=Raoultella ornithinolytica TaxID=54291 RepID=UPI001914B1E7|nr:cysteine dioxygenase [Raoultella ornithinolytica]EKW7680049.1 cysteine dioxygenase [Raoultella ornithinolytica]ELN4410203.1 cysteine dioxygenase [Raoultella ornithinolytica]ELT0847173.1 cysteine dioxygenase [Raoultella ornithinolytica]QQQ08292.1 cysteine dioxygenase [Raoultella ornithinolytica]WPJ13661.1 cysteine dioxygenase [Raoultella ornithinolytica]